MYVLYISNIRNSNISSKIFCSALRVEILRIARTTSTYNEFRASSVALINSAQNEGGNVVKKEGFLKKVLKRTPSQNFGRHLEVSQKFNDTSIAFINSLFD